MIGKILGGRYEIIGQIGEGGMAVVYKAVDKKLSRYVAIKILRKEYLDNQEFLKRFNIESQAAASLSHPNIVSIYDVGFEDNLHYIVMEHVKGKTLKQAIKEKAPFSEKEILNISGQICMGLEHAHKNHIIHRDIKSHNIIITNDGIVKITDFGIARDVNSTTLTSNGDIIGSVHYFAPEQARGERIDEKSDIYSLGVVMYEMATGRLPFDDSSAISIALKHLNEDVLSPSNFNKNISFSLERIILKAMEKNSYDRYITASLMLNDINKAKGELNEAFVPSPKKDAEDTRIIGSAEFIKALEEKDNELKRKDNKKDSKKDGSIKKGESEEEDMGKKTKKGKLDRNAKIAIGVSFAIIIAVVGVIYFLVNNLLNMPKEVKVPAVSGYSLSEAKKILKGQNLNWRIVETVHDDSLQKGVVLNQNPEADRVVRANSTVKLKVNEGAQKIKVPDVTGKTVEEAKSIFQDKGFTVDNVSVVQQNDDTVPKDKIISQNPLPGTSIEASTKIQLYVSLGKQVQQIPVPDVVGLTKDAAVKQIESDKLKAVVGGSTPSDQPKDTVISQTLRGSFAAPGTTISIVLSNGQPPAPTTAQVPNLIGLSQSDAINAIKKSNLSLQGVDSVDSDQPKDTVLKQTLKPFSTANVNDPIGITVSSGHTSLVSKILEVNIPDDVTDATVNITVSRVNADGSLVQVYSNNVDTSKKTYDITVSEKAGSTYNYQIKIGSKIYSATVKFDSEEGQ